MIFLVRKKFYWKKKTINLVNITTFCISTRVRNAPLLFLYHTNTSPKCNEIDQVFFFFIFKCCKWDFFSFLFLTFQIFHQYFLYEYPQGFLQKILKNETSRNYIKQKLSKQVAMITSEIPPERFLQKFVQGYLYRSFSRVCFGKSFWVSFRNSSTKFLRKSGKYSFKNCCRDLQIFIQKFL